MYNVHPACLPVTLLVLPAHHYFLLHVPLQPSLTWLPLQSQKKKDLPIGLLPSKQKIWKFLWKSTRVQQIMFLSRGNTPKYKTQCCGAGAEIKLLFGAGIANEGFSPGTLKFYQRLWAGAEIRICGSADPKPKEIFPAPNKGLIYIHGPWITYRATDRLISAPNIFN